MFTACENILEAVKSLKAFTLEQPEEQIDQLEELSGRLYDKGVDSWSDASDWLTDFADKTGDLAGETWEKSKDWTSDAVYKASERVSEIAAASPKVAEEIMDGVESLSDSVLDLVNGI